MFFEHFPVFQLGSKVKDLDSLNNPFVILNSFFFELNYLLKVVLDFLCLIFYLLNQLFKWLKLNILLVMLDTQDCLVLKAINKHDEGIILAYITWVLISV